MRTKPHHHPPLSAGSLALALAEACWGIALVLSTDRVLHRVAKEPVDRPVIYIARVLGARELCQALITAWRPTRRMLRFAAAVDAAHAVTMVAAAAWAGRSSQTQRDQRESGNGVRRGRPVQLPAIRTGVASCICNKVITVQDGATVTMRETVLILMRISRADGQSP